jgi:hypothetical protein
MCKRSIGLCSLAAALPFLTPNPQRISFTPMAASLEGIATLPTLRLPLSLPTAPR